MKGYFDNAATTYPKPEEMYQFMDKFYREQGGNAGRGQYKLAAEASKIVYDTRRFIKLLLNCENKDVIFTPSATIALNMVIQGSINDSIHNVYISPFEHNAVTRTLYEYEKKGKIRVEILPLNDDYNYDINHLKELFNNNRPDMVVLSHGSNVCGLISPAKEIFELAKEYNAITILDMAQTAGLVPFYVGDNNVDYAIFAGHKTLYGPFGIGGFIKKIECTPKPIIFGGTGLESALQEMPKTLPNRYEPGSSNIQAISGLYASLQWFLENIDIIRDREYKNHYRLLDIVKNYSNINIIGPKDRSKCIGVVSCLFDGYSAENIGDVLDRFGIAVRTGLHCSPYAHKFLGTFPVGTVRLSVSYFTNEEDFKKLEEALDYIEDNS